jgi:exodeoxyribonuclease V alpha subunit
LKSSPIIEPTPFPLQELQGTLERLTYHNEENGYTVARLIPLGKTYEVTVVGSLAGVNIGESLNLQGMWTNHPQYGRQFEVRTFTVKYPASIEGIRKYLGSGLIKGVGPATAARIVDRFGLDTLDVIEKQPERLSEVPGIGARRTDQISQAWEAQKHIKDIMVFLQGYEVSTALAVKIYKTYGDSSITVIRSNPYQMARDIYGIGFRTADKIARQMGLALDAPTRIQAGLLYTLGALSNEGHCFATLEQLSKEAARLMEIDQAACEAQVEQLVKQRDLILEEDAVYLPPFYLSERGCASKLRRIQLSASDRLKDFKALNWDWAFAWLDSNNQIQLTEQQKAGIRMALTEKVSVLTGGPGTGKSTITASIIRLLQSRHHSVLLAAPTGRAAKRLNETTGLEAKTIHRLLEYSQNSESQFLRDQKNPLDADLIIVDETSMVDILLMNHLLNAVEYGSHLLLIGDVDQLPSVGPGNVLRDLIGSETIPVTRLDIIFRQAEDSFIIVNAHRINSGDLPLFERNARDFFLFSEPDAKKASDWVVDLVSDRIPNKFGYRSQDIQVLSPMHRGSAGVSELNQRLQQQLNPPDARKLEVEQNQRTFRVGDRVMQMRNDYDRLVFNGDMGHIHAIDVENQVVTVIIDGRPVEYEYNQLDELLHSYAASIHKAQGSEFPVVVIPILTEHYRLLQRNLLYTAVTRARELVVLVGSKRAINLAVRNDHIASRNTRLAQRIRDYKLPDQRPGYHVENMD